MGLSWFQPTDSLLVTEDTSRHVSECIIDTGIVTEMCIAVAIFFRSLTYTCNIFSLQPSGQELLLFRYALVVLLHVVNLRLHSKAADAQLTQYLGLCIYFKERTELSLHRWFLTASRKH